MISSVSPWTRNMVDSVTTIDCSLRNATKNPLNAPTAAPIASPAATAPICPAAVSCGIVATTALTSETAAPAERSNPPTTMTKVCPIAVSASGAPLVMSEVMS